MTGWIGVLLVVAASGAMGISASLELRRRVRDLEEGLELSGRMRMEVCVRRLSLPQVLQVLAEAYPRRFPDVQDTLAALPQVPFRLLWSAVVQAMGLCPEAGEPLAALGEALSRGDEPERAFALCEERLRAAGERAARLQEERSRLYTALGVAGGCLLAIVLW